MIDAILTVGHGGVQDASHGLIRSAREAFPDLRRYILLTDCADRSRFDAEAIDVNQVAAYLGASVADIFAPEQQLVAGLPAALELLLEVHNSVLFVDSGCLFTGTGGLGELESALSGHSMALVIESIGLDRHSATPLVRVLQDREVLSSRVLAVQAGNPSLLERWKQAFKEILVDVAQRRPSDLVPALLSSFAGTPDVAMVGVETLMSFRDYSSVACGQSSGNLTPFARADELWSIARMRRKARFRAPDRPVSRDEREMDAETEARWLHLLRGSHDAAAVEHMIDLVAESVESAPSTPSSLYDQFAAELRRSIDPFSHRFPAGSSIEFRGWLYEKNQRGLTRIAHLWWAHSSELQDRFPGVRTRPDQFLDWCRRQSFAKLGFDLLDASVSPVVLEGTVDVPTPALTRVRTALKWRFNTAKMLLPGYGSWQRRRVRVSETNPRRVRAPERKQVVATPMTFGALPQELSVIGLFRSESGLGQAARSSLAALRLLERPFTYIDTTEEYLSRNAADPGLAREKFGATGGVNLIHANADELSTLGHRVFKHRLAGRFNAAMWFWEAGTLPRRAWPAFDVVDELWLASEYLADVFGQYGRVPVKVIGLAAELPEAREVDRSVLNFRDDELVFLFVYDALSAHGRKNPEKALRAFIRAFGPRFDGVRFVLKVSNLHLFADERARIYKLKEECSALTILDGYLTREAVLDLMAAADVYVSLHAAEGFGLTLLEAMAMGTPVICTGYSGNMDFTTAENSWLVDYEMTAIQDPTGPYPLGSVWASPSVDGAVDAMRQIVAEPSTVKHKAELAMRDARRAASLERYAARLDNELRRVL